MEPTTQTPPARPESAQLENAQSESRTQPLPSTERDFRTRPSRTASPGFRIAVIIAAVVLLVVGVFLYRYVTSYESTDDAQVDGHINSISTRISGHVVKLNVLDNQYVEAGRVLVEIDPADYQVAYDRAKADFDSAQAAPAEAGVDVPITSVSTSSQMSAGREDAAAPAPASLLPGSSSRQPRPSATRPRPTTLRRRTISVATSSSWTNRKFRSSNTIRPWPPPKPMPLPSKPPAPQLMLPSLR